MKCIDFRLGFLQVVYVTVLSIWIWRWLVTWDPQAKRVRAWRP